MATTANGRDGASKPRRARQGLVLIMELDSDIQDLILLILQKDYALVSIADGKEFMEGIDAYNPDLIILASGVPEQQPDGYRLYRQLRAQARFRDIPVLFLGFMVADAAFRKALKMHGDAYLIKPFFDANELRETATRLITATP